MISPQAEGLVSVKLQQQQGDDGWDGGPTVLVRHATTGEKAKAERARLMPSGQVNERARKLVQATTAADGSSLILHYRRIGSGARRSAMQNKASFHLAFFFRRRQLAIVISLVGRHQQERKATKETFERYLTPSMEGSER